MHVVSALLMHLLTLDGMLPSAINARGTILGLDNHPMPITSKEFDVKRFLLHDHYFMKRTLSLERR
jgi:hypothetical protein